MPCIYCNFVDPYVKLNEIKKDASSAGYSDSSSIVLQGLTPIWVTGDRVKLTLKDFSQIIKKMTAISLEVLQNVHWSKMYQTRCC